MRIKYISLVVILLTLVAVFTVFAASGTLDSSAPPDSTSSYTLEDIYNRLDAGTAGTQSTFTEPSSGPAAGTGHTLIQIMAQAPAVDDTNGVTQTHVLTGTTFWGLTSGQWGVITGTMPDNGGGSAAVPKTGDTYNDGCCTGEDGELQKGVSWPTPRFTDNSDGTVTDNLTGLIWLEDANCWGNQTWANALTSANSLASTSCGLTDDSSAGEWRLPNVRELQSLIHYGVYNPAVPNTAGTGQWSEGDPFTGVQSNYYWSSTTPASSTSYAWNVGLGDGYVYFGDKTYARYVWPVRGGQ